MNPNNDYTGYLYLHQLYHKLFFRNSPFKLGGYGDKNNDHITQYLQLYRTYVLKGLCRLACLPPYQGMGVIMYYTMIITIYTLLGYEPPY